MGVELSPHTKLQSCGHLVHCTALLAAGERQGAGDYIEKVELSIQGLVKLLIDPQSERVSIYGVKTCAVTL